MDQICGLKILVSRETDLQLKQLGCVAFVNLTAVWHGDYTNLWIEGLEAVILLILFLLTDSILIFASRCTCAPRRIDLDTWFGPLQAALFPFFSFSLSDNGKRLLVVAAIHLPPPATT